MTTRSATSPSASLPKPEPKTSPIVGRNDVRDWIRAAALLEVYTFEQVGSPALLHPVSVSATVFTAFEREPQIEARYR